MSLTFVIEKKVTGGNKMLLEKFQVIKENGKERFAVVEFSEFKKAKDIFSSTQKLQNYLDYIHIQEMKEKNEKRFSLKEAKKILGL